MKLVVRQRSSSLGGGYYDVLTESKELAYRIKYLGTGNKMFRILDSTGREIAIISEHSSAWNTAYNIRVEKRSLGTVLAAPSLGSSFYRIIPLDWKIRREGMEWMFSIFNASNERIARVKREFSWSSVYSIDLENPDDALYSLILVVVLEAEHCKKR